AIENDSLLFCLLVALDLLEPSTDLGFRNLVERAEEALITSVLLLQLGEAGGGGFELRLLRVDRGLLLREVARDGERFGDEIAGPALVLLLALLVGLQDARGARHPAVGGDEVAVVLHGLSPIVHQMLI